MKVFYTDGACKGNPGPGGFGVVCTKEKLDHEEVVMYTSFEQLFESMLFFSTKKGFVKLVSGSEFETNRSVISATKLEKEDQIINITTLSANDMLAGDRRVILLTKDGLSLAFNLDEVSQLKRSSRGVKGISLSEDDTVVYGTVVAPDEGTICFHDKTYNISKLRNRRRCAKGQKNKL